MVMYTNNYNICNHAFRIYEKGIRHLRVALSHIFNAISLEPFRDS